MADTKFVTYTVEELEAMEAAPIDENLHPLVSICSLSYNHENYLRDAFEGFFGQEVDFQFEIIIHDDASKDNSQAIIREYMDRYPGRVRAILQTQNQYSQGIHNVSGVFNFPRARGKYIAMCEGDDFFCDMQKLKKQIDYMEAHDECSMTCHAARIVYMDDAFHSEDEIRPFDHSGVLTPDEVIAKKGNIPTASLVFRTEFARTLPVWYYDCPVGDIPLHLYMLMNGDVYYFNEIMSAYRSGSPGSWQDRMTWGEMEKQKKKWESHYEDMKKLFEAFDADTQSRYRSSVDDAIGRQRFSVDLKELNFDVVLDPKNDKYLRELPDTERRLLRLRAKHPKIYELMRSTYRMFKK